MSSNDLKTEAIVLRRTKYGEADRIVNFLTPVGRKSAIVKGARREKSKMAGGIEMFCLTDIILHERVNSGADSLAVLTSARTKKFYGNIISSLDRLELGSEILKKVARAADNFDSPDLFNLTNECFSALDTLTAPLILTETYFTLNLASICGEQLNLMTDVSGAKLSAESRYNWDGFARAFTESRAGNYGPDHIKFLRLMQAAPLSTVLRVQNLETLASDVSAVSRSLSVYS